MTEKMLRGKRVRVGAVYEGLRRGKNIHRKWAMVQELGKSWWKPAWVDELEEIQDER